MLRSLLALGLTSVCLLHFAACACPKKHSTPSVYRGGAYYDDAVHQ
jgi:hypothetical protein